MLLVCCCKLEASHYEALQCKVSLSDLFLCSVAAMSSLNPEQAEDLDNAGGVLLQADKAPIVMPNSTLCLV